MRCQEMGIVKNEKMILKQEKYRKCSTQNLLNPGLIVSPRVLKFRSDFFGESDLGIKPACYTESRVAGAAHF